MLRRIFLTNGFLCSLFFVLGVPRRVVACFVGEVMEWESYTDDMAWHLEGQRDLDF